MDSLTQFEKNALRVLSSECNEAFDNRINEFKKEASQLNDEIAKVNTEIQEYGILHMTQEQQASVEEAKVQTIQQELESLQINSNKTLPNQIQEIEHKQKSKILQLKQMEQELNSMIGKNQMKIDSLECQCKLYEKYLGMRFGVINGMFFLLLFIV